MFPRFSSVACSPFLHMLCPHLFVSLAMLPFVPYISPIWVAMAAASNTMEGWRKLKGHQEICKDIALEVAWAPHRGQRNTRADILKAARYWCYCLRQCRDAAILPFPSMAVMILLYQSSFVLFFRTTGCFSFHLSHMPLAGWCACRRFYKQPSPRQHKA